MTSSGISISKELDAAFAKARAEGNTRFLECDIVDEALTVTHVEPLQGGAEQQWAAMHARLQPKLPHLVLFRLDEKNGELGFAWALLSYVPDGSPVRKRMLFASSHDRCKKELGAAYFVSELHGSEPAELTWAAFREHVATARTVRTDDVMSATERALVREAVQEVDSGGSNAHAVRFPASKAASEALASGDTLVVLRLDLATETIELAERAEALALADLPAHIDKQEPRFVVFRWAHEHEGAAVNSTVFVYSCPESAPVKAKMSYSTVKSIAVELAGKVDAKLEVTDLEGQDHELTEENLAKTLHPPAVEARSSNRVTKPKVARPRKLVK